MSRVAEATGLSREISEGVVLDYNAAGRHVAASVLPAAAREQESLSGRRPGGRQSRRLKHGSTNRGGQLDLVKVLRRVQVILARFIDDTE